MDKSLVDKAVVFMTNDESAEAADPSDRALDLPATTVAPQFPAVLGMSALVYASPTKQEPLASVWETARQGRPESLRANRDRPVLAGGGS